MEKKSSEIESETMWKQIMDKIKTFITKIKTKIFYNRCYNRMEAIAIAVFGMCSGAYVEEYRKEKCSDCPYFRDLEI